MKELSTYEHRYMYIVKFHLYICQVEYRCNSEVEAQLKYEEYDRAFKVLLGESYTKHIKKFELTRQLIDFSKHSKNYRVQDEKIGRPASREFEDGMNVEYK